MLIFYKELTIAEGFCVLFKHRNERRVDGIKVSAPSGATLWKDCYTRLKPMKCWNCGVEADRFIVKHQRNDAIKPPVVELYAHTGRSLVMMTRDHIIPASLGGSNDIENLRPGCEKCNNGRGNKMNDEDTKFMEEHPHLIVKK